MDEGRNMILLFPTLIDFETPEDRKNFDIRYDLSTRVDLGTKSTADELLAVTCSIQGGWWIFRMGSQSGQASVAIVI